MRLAAVSLTFILRTRTMCTASILRITLESFSFLYAFSNSSRFVTSMTWLYGKGSLLLSIWQIYPERTFSRRYRCGCRPTEGTVVQNHVGTVYFRSSGQPWAAAWRPLPFKILHKILPPPGRYCFNKMMFSQ